MKDAIVRLENTDDFLVTESYGNLVLTFNKEVTFEKGNTIKIWLGKEDS